jgi:hypothetical protein
MKETSEIRQAGFGGLRTLPVVDAQRDDSIASLRLWSRRGYHAEMGSAKPFYGLERLLVKGRRRELTAPICSLYDEEAQQNDETQLGLASGWRTDHRERGGLLPVRACPCR